MRPCAFRRVDMIGGNRFVGRCECGWWSIAQTDPVRAVEVLQMHLAKAEVANDE